VTFRQDIVTYGTLVPMDIDTRTVVQLRRSVWGHYKAHGRHDLPWRHTTNPYRILVSEIMLQQTQVDRVVPKYQAFLKRFPTVRALAHAPLADVLGAWQGLGYNRRAKALHDAAHELLARYHGRVPRAYDELVRLPGVGPYTAGAVCVFAFGENHPLIETNVRTVIFHHLLRGRDNVPDSELREIASEVCDRARPREWYWALMDYGASLKRQGVRLNTVSKHYSKQSRFEGSDRQIRGAVLKALLDGAQTAESLQNVTRANRERLTRQLNQLAKERLVIKQSGVWSLPH
jgi:A/G-specific adenine glycosylase